MADVPIDEEDVPAPPEPPMQQSAKQAVYGEPMSWPILGPTSYAAPIGTGRMLELTDLTNDPIYVQFGDAGTIATAASTRMDYGTARYMMPDDATHVSVFTAPPRRIVARWGWVEKEPI